MHLVFVNGACVDILYTIDFLLNRESQYKAITLYISNNSIYIEANDMLLFMNH